MALTSSCSLVTGPAAGRLSERVTVEQGPLVGAVDGPVVRYQGIPYAAPPVGPLRWQPPQPPPSWTEEREATAPGARCPQLAAAPGTPHATAASDTEDCLTLNVTAPAGTTPNARRPVLVWIHGGGFSAGAGSDVDPHRLVEAGPMIVVTVNYRLGVLGFLGLPGLPGSGSFGLLDQQQALRWVQRNIAAFGGDPGNVTLAGESAGADSVCAQLAAPGSAGLFRRAVLQSGGCSTANIIDVIRPGTGASGDTWKPLPVAESIGPPRRHPARLPQAGHGAGLPARPAGLRPDRGRRELLESGGGHRAAAEPPVGPGHRRPAAAGAAAGRHHPQRGRAVHQHLLRPGRDPGHRVACCATCCPGPPGRGPTPPAGPTGRATGPRAGSGRR